MEGKKGSIHLLQGGRSDKRKREEEKGKGIGKKRSEYCTVFAGNDLRRQ